MIQKHTMCFAGLLHTTSRWLLFLSNNDRLWYVEGVVLHCYILSCSWSLYSITVVTDSDAIRNPLGLHYQCQDSLLVRAPDSWSEGCKFKFRQERQENFLLQCLLCVLTLIQCPFHPRVTAVVHKRPWSFCQKCRWQVNLSTHTPLTQQTRIGLTMLLSRHSVGTY